MNLQGEWSFYWEALVPPAQLDAPSAPTPSGFAEVPGSWDRFEVKGRTTQGHGYATYWLRVSLPAHPPRLALKLIDVGTAFALYVNGSLLHTDGVVGESAHVSRPGFHAGVVDLPASEVDELALVLHVSNFHYRTGGIWEPIVLGFAADVRQRREAALAYALFLAGSIAVMALYHFGLFSLRRQDRSTLYFGLFCLLIVFRILSTEERYLSQLLPGMGWAALLRVEYGSFLLAAPLFAVFVHVIFPGSAPRWMLGLINGGALAFTFVVLVSPPQTFSSWLPTFQAYTLAVCGYGVYVLVCAVVTKRENARACLAGVLILVIAVLADILASVGVLRTSILLVGPGIFLFIVIQAYLVSSRSATSFAVVERMAQELEVYAAALEDKVAKRTSELEQVNQQLERLASVDGLTHIANRRRFDEAITRAWADHRRRGAPLALVLCDIDFFKHYNDSYGHVKGDAVLRAVAQAIRGALLRPNDMAARYGGDEFAVLLLDTGVEGATSVAERLRRAVGDLHIPHGSSEAGPEVSLSLGFAEIVPIPEVEPVQLIGMADGALYEAKKQGRNRGVVAAPHDSRGSRGPGSAS